jgi:hypothetical protein
MMNRFITSACALAVCLNISSNSVAADSNGNIIVNNSGGMTIAVDSKVNTGIDLGEGGDKNVIKGNGNIKTETRKLEEFKAIKISGAFDVVAIKGDSPSIKITCDSNLIPHILSKVLKEELSIMPDRPISCKNKVKIELCVSGGASRVDLSGACALMFKDIATGGFTLNLDGVSSATISGKADVFESNIAGACSLKADELKAKVTSVSISGTGKADVFASEKLTANISGIGVVNYYGNPKDVVKDVSLLGQLNKK